jgi:hypothetical protein
VNCDYRSCGDCKITKQGILIGSDPEFTVWEPDGTFVRARDAFLETCLYPICDEDDDEEECSSSLDYVNAHGPNGFAGTLGTDGNESIGEMRPLEESCPKRHFRNLVAVVSETLDTLSGYVIAAGNGGRRATGGHLHFSYHAPLIGQPAWYDRTDTDIWQREMYFLVGSTCHYLSDPFTLEERSYEGYGKLADYRGYLPYHIEYRAPGSWLMTPEIAEGLLCLAFVVAQAHRSIPVPSIRCESWISQLPKKSEIMRTVERLPLFPTFEDEIRPLLNMLRKGKKWPEVDNLHDTWAVKADPWKSGFRRAWKKQQSIKVPDFYFQAGPAARFEILMETAKGISNQVFMKILPVKLGSLLRGERMPLLHSEFLDHAFDRKPPSFVLVGNNLKVKRCRMFLNDVLRRTAVVEFRGNERYELGLFESALNDPAETIKVMLFLRSILGEISVFRIGDV